MIIKKNVSYSVSATQAGFTLIEVLLASLIASIIGMALLSSFYQITRTTKSMDNAIGIHDKIALSMYQLERDLSGTFIPLQPIPKKEKPSQQNPNAKPDEKKPQEQLAPKKEQKKITHIFYSINKDEQLDTLTFITNNPMQVYWSERAGKAKPFIARVLYRLVKETSKKEAIAPSYRLMRQEDYTLDFDAYKQDSEKSIRSYELIGGIKKMIIKFGVYIEKKDSTSAKLEDSTKKKTKPEREYKTFDDWNLEKERSSDDQKETRPAVPHLVEITLSLWDAQKKREVTSVITVPIIPDFKKAEQDAAPENDKAAEPAKPETKKPELNKPSTPATPPLNTSIDTEPEINSSTEPVAENSQDDQEKKMPRRKSLLVTLLEQEGASL